MNDNCSRNKKDSERTARSPVVIAAAVAFFGVLGMLIVDHGPWSRPKVQTAEVAHYKTTGDAARAVGATVAPTAPKPEIEPVAPGLKLAQPANPATP
jgi:hypothetical protein